MWAKIGGLSNEIAEIAEKSKKEALSANQDFFGNHSQRSETPANSMFEPVGRVVERSSAVGAHLQ